MKSSQLNLQQMRQFRNKGIDVSKVTSQLSNPKSPIRTNPQLRSSDLNVDQIAQLMAGDSTAGQSSKSDLAKLIKHNSDF